MELLKKQLKQIRQSMVYINGISYERDRVQTSVKDSLSEYVARLVDKEKEVLEAMDEYNEVLDSRVKQINGLSKAEYISVLTERYINRKNFEQISVDIGYSYYRTCHLHGEALEEFTEKYLND